MEHASRCAGTIRLNDVSTRDDLANTKNTGVAGDAATDEEEEEESADEEDGNADEAERRPAARKTLATVQRHKRLAQRRRDSPPPLQGPLLETERRSGTWRAYREPRTRPSRVARHVVQEASVLSPFHVEKSVAGARSLLALRPSLLQPST